MSEGKLLRNKATKYRTNTLNVIKQNLVTYSGFVSLIKELIQNSDDSSKGENVEVSIDFRDDKLILINNTSFTENDWEKIEEIASGNKQDDPNSTGRFGIGFTSVFKICDDLNIHSKGMSKKFEFGTLDWIPYESSRYPDINITEFEFIWRKRPTESGNKIDAFELTEDELLDFQKDTIDSIYKDIHFLNNVVVIEILANGNLKQKIEIKKKNPEIISRCPDEIKKEERKIIVINSDNSKKILAFIIYSQNIDKYFTEEYNCKVARKKPLLLSIAVNKESLTRGRVFCTLPTSDFTECLFDLNCDFWPDTSRKHILMEKDEKGRYNFKILSFVPEMLLDITEDLKYSLSKVSFYNLLNSLLIIDNTFFKTYSINYLNLLKNSGSNIIFLQGQWFPVNKVKYTEEKCLFPLLSKANSSVIPQEDCQFLPVFKELGMKEFNLNDLINELKTVPVGIELEKSIFGTKNELKNIFYYFENKRNEVISNKNQINRLNIFLNTEGKLYNAIGYKFYRLPDQLLSLKTDFNLPEIDTDVSKDFEYLLSKLEIFTGFSDLDLVSKILKDFKNKNFPLKIEDSVSYLNTKDKLLIVIAFLNEYLENCIQNKKRGLIRHKGVVYDTSNFQYYSIRECYNDLETLPLILSSNNLLYQWKNDDVFILGSISKQKFADIYKIESIDQGVLDRIKSYNELSLKKIVEYVEESTKKGEQFEEEFLILLYTLFKEDSSQLPEKDLNNKIRKLPLFIDEGTLCSLECNNKKTFLKGNYDDKIGVARVLDQKLITEVPSFKESVLKKYFGIKDLTFRIYVKNYFYSLFEDDSLDVSKKLELIKELNDYHPIESNFREEVTPILKKTKLIYCKNNQFYYPYDDFIYRYITPAEKEFASMHGLEVMQNEVENIARNYDLVKGMNLKNILEYVIDDIGKVNFVMDEDYLRVLYRLILERVNEIDNRNFSTIRKLKIFCDTSGNPTTLENKLLSWDYEPHKDIHIDEILDESVISKVPGFKEKVLIDTFNLKVLNYETFINKHFKLIFENNEIKKEVKLDIFIELYIRFAKFEESKSLHTIKDTLVNSKIVYCQDGNFHYPTCENLFIKSKLSDEIFGKNYLYPDFDMGKCKHLFEVLGVKENVEPYLIVDLIKKSIYTLEVNSELINKMKGLFISINSHWKEFRKTEDFSPLSDLEWLPALNYPNELFKPSELYTQNTKPYLEHLQNIKYLDIKDSIIEKSFLNKLKLTNIDNIPISKLIDNLEFASKMDMPLTTQINSLTIYKLLNRKIDRAEIYRLNTFPSIEIRYKDIEKPFYFKPTEVFKKDLQDSFGIDYIGYLSSNFIVDCNNLLSKLDVLEEPRVNDIIYLLEKINKKYEQNDLYVSSEKDKTIIVKCLEYLEKKLNDMEESDIEKLKKLPVFCNENNRLLSADSCILENNPILCQQFEADLSDYFVKLYTNYPKLIKELKIKGLNQLVKKDKCLIDNSKRYINSDFTKKMRSISKLMSRIEALNPELENEKWMKIKPDVCVYNYEDLNVSKYIIWNSNTYNSIREDINCYLEVNWEMEKRILDEIYVKGSNAIIRQSMAQEISEEIHPRIDKNFISTIIALLSCDSCSEMNNYLTNVLGCPITEHIDATLNEKREIDESTFDDNDSFVDDFIQEEHTSTECDTVEKLDVFETSVIDNHTEKPELPTVKAEEFTDKIFIDNENATIGRSADIINTVKENINTIEPLMLQDMGGRKQKDTLESINITEKKTSSQKESEDYSKYTTQSLEPCTDEQEMLDPYYCKNDTTNKRKGHSSSRTENPTHKTVFLELYKEKYSKKYPSCTETSDNFMNNTSPITENYIPKSLEEEKFIEDKIQSEIYHSIDQVNFEDRNREQTLRLEPNKDDEIANVALKHWYGGRCQICGKTFKKKGSKENYSMIVKLRERREQGVPLSANKVCLCSYHAAILKYGEITIDFVNLGNNELNSTITNEYENGYRNSNCNIKYNETHFQELKKLLKYNTNS